MLTLSERAQHVRLAIFDVDGVLTNGALIYGSAHTESKKFHAHDGTGMLLLQKSGVDIAIITVRESDVVAKRMQDLGIRHVYQGCHDKLLAYDQLKQLLQLADHEIAYVGDDLPDLPVLRRVGLSMTVPNAPAIMQHYVHGVTKAKGGRGAAREVCELIMHARGTYESAIHSFLTR